MSSELTTSDPATWPVLAQLPRVGAAPDARRDVGIAAARDESRRRMAVDQAHVMRGYDGPPEAVALPSHPDAPQTSEKSAAKTRQFRIDQGAALRPPTRHSQSAPVTLAGQAFQLHQALAPHMGLVGAVALVLSGSLLYWLAFGPARLAANSPAASHVDGGWSSESTTQAHAPDAGDAAASTQENANSPRVAAATVTPPTAMPTTGLQSPAATPPIEPAVDGPVTNSAEPANTANDHAAANPPGEPITPTAETAAYPTTSYPVFQLAEPQSVAERSLAPGAFAPR